MAKRLMKTIASRGTRHRRATRGRRWAENSQICFVCITQVHIVHTTSWPVCIKQNKYILKKEQQQNKSMHFYSFQTHPSITWRRYTNASLHTRLLDILCVCSETWTHSICIHPHMRTNLHCRRACHMPWLLMRTEAVHVREQTARGKAFLCLPLLTWSSPNATFQQTFRFRQERGKNLKTPSFHLKRITFWSELMKKTASHQSHRSVYHTGTN